MLKDLLGDGASPLDLPVIRGQLSRQLELIIAALEGSTILRTAATGP